MKLSDKEIDGLVAEVRARAKERPAENPINTLDKFVKEKFGEKLSASGLLQLREKLLEKINVDVAHHLGKQHREKQPLAVAGRIPRHSRGDLAAGAGVEERIDDLLLDFREPQKAS